MYRSFAPLRMTALRFVVILSEAKDLYEMYLNYLQILLIGTLTQEIELYKLSRICSTF